jgi:hypothetical protein
MTFFYVFEDVRRARARRAALPLAKPRQNAFFATLFLCVKTSIHALRTSFQQSRRRNSQPFAQEGRVVNIHDEHVNFLLGV